MIRELQYDEDIEDIVDIWYRASSKAHPFLGREYHDREKDTIRNLYLPAARTFLYEMNGETVGFLSMLGSEIGGLFVDPLSQRKGIGSAMLDFLRKSGDYAGPLEVEVFEENLNARAFYEKKGFQQIRQIVHIGSGRTILRLRLEPGGDSADGSLFGTLQR